MSVAALARRARRCHTALVAGVCRAATDTSCSPHVLDHQRIPSSMQKLQVARITPNFREAVQLCRVPVPVPGDGEVLVRNRFVGVNASDINYTSGRYDPSVKPPFDVGFEGVGEVVGMGLSASAHFTVGDSVGYVMGGAFADYKVVPAMKCVVLPRAQPEVMALLLSGATAYISLKRLGELQEHHTVLVTAAAGGTGQFAVQFAKMAGCHVVGTCSSDEKADFLKTLGCDRPINYRAEKLSTVLRQEYPHGLDVVYESVGGDVFDTAVSHLTKHGRIILIGFISGYTSTSGLAVSRSDTLPVRLLKKSASLRGFFLEHYMGDYREALTDMLCMQQSGKLRCEVDLGDSTPEGRFLGLESVCRAVDYMYSGKNLGKVVVELGAAGAQKGNNGEANQGGA